MNNIIFSFLLTALAGLATIIGYFIIFIKINQDKIISFSLAFSASVMFTISFIDLLPSAFSYLKYYNFFFKYLLIFFFFILGIFISNYISLKVKNNNSNLNKIGLISLIAIILHNIPEGIITFMVSGVNFRLGMELAIAISMHNIPEGISIAIPIFYGTNNKIKTFFMVLIAGFSELFGAIICYLFLKNIITNIFIGINFSFIAGIMINISIKELLPEAILYKNNKLVFLGIIFGSITMILSHIL